MGSVFLISLLLCFEAFAVEIRPPAEIALARVRRVYIDQLGGGAGSDQMRDMLFAAIQNSGLFVLTENQEKADATLKGSSDQKIFQEEHITSDSIGVHTAEGGGSGKAVGYGISSSSHQNLSAGLSQSESSHIQEHRQEALASVRLVGVDGDIIWSTTQESNGAKFRGALADVADKVARKLTEETKAARLAVARQ